MKRELQDL
jgi:hypothetical protein